TEELRSFAPPLGQRDRHGRIAVDALFDVQRGFAVASDHVEPHEPSLRHVWSNGRMAPVVEELPDNKVRITVDVPGEDVHHAVEHAASDLAQTVKIPGFRQGKVPMPVLVSRIGKERLYTEAIESHIGAWSWNAA